MSDFNQGAPMPRGSQERWWKLYGPRGNAPLRAHLIGEAFVGRWTHFHGHTIGCYEHPECYGCKAGWPTRWMGFVAAWDCEAHEEFVLMLTAFAAEQLVTIARTHGGMRGLVIVLQRQPAKDPSKTKRNAPVNVRFQERCGLNSLPQPFDINPSIDRVFGMNSEIIRGAVARTRENKPLPGKRVQEFLEHHQYEDAGDAA